MDPILNIGSIKDCCTDQLSQTMDVTPTMSEFLTAKRDRLKVQIQDLESAIAALNSNPGIVNVLELIRRVNRY